LVSWRDEINKLVSRVEKDLQPVVEMHDGPLQKQIEQEYETHKDLSKDDLIEHLRTEPKRQITKIFDQKISFAANSLKLPAKNYRETAVACELIIRKD
jgi:hypothetical protein